MDLRRVDEFDPRRVRQQGAMSRASTIGWPGQDRKPAKNAMFRFITFPYRQHGLIALALLRYLQATVQGSLREKTATQVLVGALL